MVPLLIQITLKTTVVLMGAWLVTRAMGRGSAAARHLVWTIALVAVLVLPAVQVISPRWDLPVLPAAAPGAADDGAADASVMAPGPRRPDPARRGTRPTYAGQSASVGREPRPSASSGRLEQAEGRSEPAADAADLAAPVAPSVVRPRRWPA